MIKKLLFLLLLIILASPILSAQTPSESRTDVSENNDQPISFLISGALEFGGDNVAKIFFDDGSSQQVKAGQGGTLFVGVAFRLPSLNMIEFQTKAGIKYVTTQADNAHIRLTRYPIEGTAHWLITPDIMIGGGISVHTNITFKADGVGEDFSFDTATGWLIETSYSGFGIRYTHMSYSDEFNDSYSANAIGAFYTYTF